ncbi:MAG: pyridoxine 5'-phosphate oxidase C-terminal domain-containing protein [Bryobacteraceae bacterium]
MGAGISNRRGANWRPAGVIERPDRWGGYRVRPVRIKFWQGRENRLHDRILYRLETGGAWTIERLAP